METKTKHILNVTHVISYIIFVGLCFECGTVLFSYFVSLYRPIIVQNLYMGLNLSDLHQFSRTHYSMLMWGIMLISGLKAFIFYLLIKIFSQINFRHPFSPEVAVLISGISYVAFAIGILTMAAIGYRDWLTEKGVTFPDLEEYLGGAAEFLLLGAIIFIIAQVFKRGIEIQSENELTV